jgi:uncharacterized protein (TIGR03382 family)
MATRATRHAAVFLACVALAAGPAAAQTRYRYDPAGNLVAVVPPLAIRPNEATTPPRGSVAFAATGGSATGLAWSFVTNASGGTLDGRTGAYAAGRTGQVEDVIQVTDSLGDVATARIQVTAGVSVTPAAATTPPRGSIAFAASGGSGTGFTWTLATNASGGTVDGATGAYTAGRTGSVEDVVQATDSLGNIATARIAVTAGVSVTPPTASTPPGGSLAFAATGGSGKGFTWTLATNASGGTVDSATGTYTAGHTGSVEDVVQATDSLGNTATARITVTPGVSISGASGPAASAPRIAPITVSPTRGYTFSASGGSSTGYRWSLATNASGGHIDAVTGEYVAGTIGGVTDVVQVVDSLGNTATFQVKVSSWKIAGSGCSSTHGNGSWALLLVLGAALVRRRRRWSRFPLASAAVFAVLVASSSARAQGFEAERFQPSAGAFDILAVESALVPPHLAVSGTVYVSYADRPLRLVAPGAEMDLLSNQTTVTPGASLGLFNRLELSLCVPVVAHRRVSAARFAPGRPVPSSSGVGDVLFAPKARLLGNSRLGLAVAVPITLPTGSADSFLGYGNVTAGPRLIAEYGGERSRSLRVAANAGVALRGQRHVLDADFGNAVTYGLGAELPFRLASQRVSGVATLAGETQIGSGAGKTSPLELLGGITWRGPGGIGMTAGGGPGLTSGYGTPRYRVLLAISYVPEGASDAEERAASGLGEESQITTSPGSIAPSQPERAPSARAGEAATSSSKQPATPPVVSGPGNEERAAERRKTAERIALIRGGVVRFEFESFKIGPEYSEGLDKIATALQADLSLKVRIEGHADEQGSPGFNRWLSEKRARAVRNALAKRGVPTWRIETVGFGNARPLDGAHTLRAHRRNRRVEFVAVSRGETPEERLVPSF